MKDSEAYLTACVTVDTDNIVAEYARVSADLFYWSRKFADSEGRLSEDKARLKEAQSRAFLSARKQLIDLREKSTDKIVEAHAALMPSVISAHKSYSASLRLRTELKGILDAISSKRDMLISLGALRRQEMKSIPGMT